MAFLKQWISRALLPVILAIFAYLAYERQWLLGVDYFLYDSAQALRQPTILSDSVVVAIDEKSIHSIGRWPWPRTQHASLINHLTHSGSAAIYFDVLFADASTSSEDLALAQAIERHGRVALPLSIEPLGDRGQLIEVVPALPFYRAAAAIGHAHINCDFDGVCRSLYLREGVGLPQWYHLSAALLFKDELLLPKDNVLLPKHKMLTGRRAVQPLVPSPLLIYRDFHNFIPFSPKDRVPTVSYIDVLDGRIPADFFNNKTIFIGATAAGVHDILTTPVGRIPGVEITAFIHHHLQQGSLVQLYDDPLIVAFLCGLLVIFLAGISLLSSAKFLLGISALLLLEYMLLLSLLLGWGKWLPIAPLLIATALFYPLWSWLRLELAMRYLRRSLLTHQDKPSSTIALTQRFNVRPATAHWLVASDTVALTIEQLEAVSVEQKAVHLLLQQSISGLQEGCIIFDAKGTCFLVNDLARAWLPGWQSDNIVDVEHALNIQVPSWRDTINNAFLQQEILCCEAESLAILSDDVKANYFLQVQHCKIKLDEHSQDLAVVGILTLTNISALKASEKVREETLNFISHDLRSPLVSIISLIKYWREVQVNQGSVSDGLANSLKNTQDDSLADMLEKIELYANRNLAYSESLLQLNRAEQLSSAQTVLCDLLTICEDAYEQVLPFARAKHCLIDWRYSDDDFWVDGDYELLQRMVVNLLTNSVKYGASSRGIVLSLALENVDDASRILLTVEDFGAGMTSAQKAQAFERFTRDASPASEGAGLGLYFINTVIAHHGGHLALQSEEGQGCKITCSLPLKSLEFMD